ncbi:MAG: aspartate aminotransferase [Epulopiscium sp.]|jgi:aspartate aminotransferase|uniref:Aminotransferase n=1 Tax=Defluviitalea raffinosedens TaxID=1450156 RepID=A0A7C8HGS4_9FIRM|nr:pyridoxal phosphate-dependent aminotransferase [Defluviitalea raffinosedens]MBZ4667903.1 aspartate/tyrosine/aromatic aminotransferase [Defluviitaleaceae bacterium]MDK2787717.1 aspartate aminotransferase [Candidatus Epulonipiscium sp.]KAE9629820.1 aminotransferase class I/II-fold pyridoxal phosphate-dependent enzyme [Defluviitalea raffinosedens]MBM7686617.1 aspartate aminotransferase [Defluviitalea raffinosedens]HHW67900.1 pyridoxal phosphate-dependent aminotransferase [Candidatus Epulonipis
MKLSNKVMDITPSSTLAVTAKAKQMKAEGIDVVGFGAGEPDFDTPEHIKQAAIKAIEDGFTKYTPASGTVELKKAICHKLKNENGLDYKQNQIVISNGAKHSLTNAFTAILNPGDEVIIPAPFWLSYPQMVKLADGVPVIVYAKKENDFKVTIEDLEKAVTDKTKALVVNSPSNPTGVVYTEKELRAIADFAVKYDLYVISDEIYEKLIYDGIKHVSIASFNEEIYKRTIIINGVSKSYSMTGWRIGYLAAPEDVAKAISNVQSHATSNPNSIAQKAALAALTGPQDCVEVMRKEFEARRNYMVERLSKISSFSIIKPQGAFYVVIDISNILGKEFEGRKIETADDFSEILLEKESVAVVSCTDFGFSNCIRLSYAISLENIKKGLDRIENFVNNKL